MNNRPFQFLVATIFLVLLSCVCVGLVGLAVYTNLPAPTTPTLAALPPPSRIPVATREPTQPPPTSTPAPTYTLVLQPGTPLPPLGVYIPTRAIPYKVAVPTPTAQKLKYPVTYETSFNVVTYPVSGETTELIARSLDANALTDSHSPLARYYALTTWNVSSRWTWQPTGLGCEVDKAQVIVAVTMTLPALTASNISQDARKRWDTFIANTITHETEHVKLAFDGARGYQRDISYWPPALNCDLIETQLNNLFKKDYNAIDQANVDYDAKTKHGATQGAVFP